MYKYIKWELIDEFKRKILLYGAIVAVYILFFIFPLDSSISHYLSVPYVIILIGSLSLSYFYGAKRTMESFEKKSFLLESMIPISPNKILFAKYILAILFDILYSIVFIIGVSILFAKGDINIIKEIVEFLFDLELDTIKIIFKLLIFLVSSTIAFTALTSFVFIMIKSVFPNDKALKIAAYIISVILLDIYSGLILESLSAAGELIPITGMTVGMLLLTTACYFGSVWFVKNKLEIYN